ncbi:MAG: septal ring lytic transglycosylase RlpA family protein, partial [Comamonadaceae bacterium]
WYGPRFHGRRSANGERYDMHSLTAAHKTLPFGTLVLVRSVKTGREVVVRITDRGRLPGRVIDLSRAAAKELGMLGLGLTEVLLLDSFSEPGRQLSVEPAPPMAIQPLEAPTGP